MKKIKLISLLAIIFIVTGCEANYNLTIEKDKMIETVDFFADNTKANSNIIKTYLDGDLMAYYDLDSKMPRNYEKKGIDSKNKVGLNLSYEYSDDNLQKSALLNMCYYNKNIIKTDDTLIITTDGKAMCFYKDGQKTLDKLTINIKSNFKVLENNADKIEDDVYTWYITDENYQNHPINLKVDLTSEKKDYTFIIISLCVLGGLILAAISVLVFVYIKNRQNNRL